MVPPESQVASDRAQLAQRPAAVPGGEGWRPRRSRRGPHLGAVVDLRGLPRRRRRLPVHLGLRVGRLLEAGLVLLHEADQRVRAHVLDLPPGADRRVDLVLLLDEAERDGVCRQWGRACSACSACYIGA